MSRIGLVSKQAGITALPFAAFTPRLAGSPGFRRTRSMKGSLRSRLAGTAAVIMLLAAEVPSANANALFTNKAAFLTAAAGHTALESFESFFATNTATSASILASSFSITTNPESNLGIFSGTQASGLHPTEGSRYAVWAARPTDPDVSFTFAQPINAFALTLTDALDGGIVSAQLRLRTSSGVETVVTSGSLPSGNEKFIGVIGSEPFTQVVLTVTAMPSTGDGMGIDEVRYGNTVVAVVGTVTADCDGLPIGLTVNLAPPGGGILTTLTRPGLLITTGADARLGVLDAPFLDVHATHGGRNVVWSALPGNPEVTLRFTHPITAFGIMLTDALDGGIPSAQVKLRTSNGDESVVTSGALASGTEKFIGLIANAPFTEVVVTVTAMPSSGDGLGLDEVRFGTLPTVPTTTFFTNEGTFLTATIPGLAMESFEFSPTTGPAASASVSIPQGRYVFEGVSKSSGAASVSLVVPSEYTVASPPGGEANVPLTVNQTVDFALHCPITGDLVGTVSAACNGSTAAAQGVTVRLLDEGLPFLTTITGPAGDFHFEDVDQGTYTVVIEPPTGYGIAPDTRLVAVDQAEVTLDPFVLTCLLADVTGQVTGACNGQTSGLQGVTVDVFRDDSQGTDVLVATIATDAQGNYRFDDLALGAYTVGIVLPLGYTTASASQEVALTTPDGLVAAQPFSFNCQVNAAQPRGIGYWKHQVNVYLTGKGRAEETLAELLHYTDELVVHFNENLVNPVIVYVSGATNTNDKLLQLQQLLTVNRGGTTLDRAKQEILSLLLNVVSGKINQTEQISDNGATVSQAITYSHDLIVDGDPGNDPTAQAIGELINGGQRVPSGMVPATTRVITYDRRPTPTEPHAPVALRLGPIAPNPATLDATLTFALPSDAPAMLEIHDLAGRLIARQQVGSRGVGIHTFRLAEVGRLRPGIYLVRLIQAGVVKSLRLAVIR